MTQVEMRLKPDPDVCVCGCGLVGPVRVKQWKDGLGPHVKRCQCRRCKGGRTSSRARRQEHRTARDTGGQREPMSGVLSGIDGRAGLHVWEQTSELGVCRGIRRWWKTKTVQRKIRRLMAQRGVYRWLVLTDEKPWLVVGLFEDWAAPMVRGRPDE